MYEFAATREQTALREFLRWEAPAATNEGSLERKDSKRTKKALLGSLSKKGRNPGVKGLAEGRKTSGGKRYFQIVVDEVEMERQRKEREQGGQEIKNAERAARIEKGEEEKKIEGRLAKTTSDQVRNTNTCHSGVAPEHLVVRGGTHAPKQDPESKTAGKAKSKDKGKTKDNFNPGENRSPARSFRLLPKPDLGSPGHDLVSEGSGILARFGVASNTKNDHSAPALDMKGFTQGETTGRHLPKVMWNKSDESSNQTSIPRNQISGFVPIINNPWSIPGLSQASDRETRNPAPESSSKAAAPVQLQDPAQKSRSLLSTKTQVPQTQRDSPRSPTGPCPNNSIPTTPQTSAQNSTVQAWPTNAPITPQHSAQNSIETKKSPCSILKHSRAPSAFSAHGSIADDGQSDVGSIEIMNAQSAEIVRVPGVAGFFARSTAKLPKPGPAPTRALPSLPEGYDGPAGALGRANGGSPTRMGTEPTLARSPVKVPPSSPNGGYRYSPCRSPAKPLAVPSEPNGTLEHQRSFSDSSPTMPSQRSAISARRKGSLAGDMNVAMLEQAQIERTRATKALKGRDLQRLYSDQISTDVVQPGLRHDEKDGNNKDGNNKEGSLLPSTRYTPGVATHSVPQEVAKKDLATTPFPSQVDPSHHQRACKVSPIILVTEQAPIQAQSPFSQNNTNTRNGADRTEHVGILHTAQDVANENLQVTPGCEDKERSYKETTPDRLPEAAAAWREPRAKSQRSNDTTNRMPPNSDQLSFNNKDIESKLEARISALERKNTILLRVVMAVLDESGNLSAPSGGDRSSGLSSSSSLYGGSRESRLEAKFDAVLSFLQESKRLSAEQ